MLLFTSSVTLVMSMTSIDFSFGGDYGCFLTVLYFVYVMTFIDLSFAGQERRCGRIQDH